MRRLLLGATAALAPALFGLHAAKAAPVTISLSESGVSVSANSDSSPPPTGFIASPETADSPGEVAYFGRFGTFALNVTTGTGGSDLPQYGIDLNSTDAVSRSGADGTLTLTVSEADFSGSTGLQSFLASIGGTISGSISSVTYSAYVDPTNTLNSTVPADLVYSNTFTGPGSFSSDGFSTLAPGLVYSMTEVITVTSKFTFPDGSGLASFDAQLLPVPEPGTLALMGGSLMMFGLIWARRSRQS